MDDDRVGAAPAAHLAGQNFCPTIHGFRVMDSEDHPGTTSHLSQGQVLEPRNHLGLKMNDIWRAAHHCSA
jgi:hypothetical protein